MSEHAHAHDLTDDHLNEAVEQYKAQAPKFATAAGTRAAYSDETIREGLRGTVQVLAADQPKGKINWKSLLEKAIQIMTLLAPLLGQDGKAPAPQP